MRIIRFEDIIVWQKGQDLAVEIYRYFKEIKDWDFRNQNCRAVVSISNNIAEGFDRTTNPDFKRFLSIARASCSEVKSMLYLAGKLGYVDEKNAELLINRSIEILKMINGLMKKL